MSPSKYSQTNSLIPPLKSNNVPSAQQDRRPLLKQQHRYFEFTFIIMSFPERGDELSAIIWEPVAVKKTIRGNKR